VLAENEFTPEELRGEADALWLARVPAFQGVLAAFTTRDTLGRGAAASFRGGVPDAEGRIPEEFIARVCATVGFPYGRLATCRQVHGVTVCRVDVAERRWFDRCDGLATDLPDAPLAVFTADCVPVVLWAPAARALALLHAGWRGTLAKIVAAGVATLRDAWGAAPAEVSVFLGPAVGPCCYVVGDDVAREAEAAFGRRAAQVLPERDGARRLDLHRANELVAQEAGVPATNIYRVRACTSCDAALFASRRRDGERAGRMVALASVAAAPPPSHG